MQTSVIYEEGGCKLDITAHFCTIGSRHQGERKMRKMADKQTNRRTDGWKIRRTDRQNDQWKDGQKDKRK